MRPMSIFVRARNFAYSHVCPLFYVSDRRQPRGRGVSTSCWRVQRACGSRPLANTSSKFGRAVRHLAAEFRWALLMCLDTVPRIEIEI